MIVRMYPSLFFLGRSGFYLWSDCYLASDIVAYIYVDKLMLDLKQHAVLLISIDLQGLSHFNDFTIFVTQPGVRSM
jgi:hypothetical protein